MGETLTYEQLCRAFCESRDLEQRWTCTFFQPQRIRRDDEYAWVPGWEPSAVVEVNWIGLVKGLTRFREVPSKAECPGWMPVRLSTPRRRLENVLEVTCLVLDIDDGTDIEVVSERFSSWPHIIHTSYSSTPQHHKARVVLPLEEPCPARWFPRLWEWGQARLGGSVDEQTKDASRYFFLPALGPGGHNVAIVHEEPSRCLDLRPYEDLPESRDERASREANRRRVEYQERKKRGDAPAGRERADELKHDAGAREALGGMLGGRLSGGKVKGVPCPSCGRPSVWWPIEPRGYPGAMCDHRGSCGWRGWLDTLEGA